MAALDPPGPVVAKPSISTNKLVWKPNNSNMLSWSTQKTLIDDTLYNITVLRLPSTTSEDELDDQISLEAQHLGITLHPAANSDGLSSSRSIMTMASVSVNQSPVRSQSTAPTSCASSEHRPVTSSSRVSNRSPSCPDVTSMMLENEGKKDSSFRGALRKLPGFRKRRSRGLTASSTLTSISSDAETNASEEASIGARKPAGIKPNKDSWLQPAFVATTDGVPPALVDIETLERSMECKELLDLRLRQLDEKARFLEFQSSLFARLRSQRDILKTQKKTEQEELIAERRVKVSGRKLFLDVCAKHLQNEQSVEDLERRQLEEEMKMEQEHDLEKRAVMLRLRHMEAYCQNPTPPPTPVDPSSGRPSVDSNLPQRRVTDKDYHNLAQQYREREIMDTLQASKINVLRGRQKRAVENLMQRKERELEILQREQMKEIALIDRDFTNQETDIRLGLEKKRARLEVRWRNQAYIERTKMEKATGQKYASLADVTAIEGVLAGPGDR